MEASWTTRGGRRRVTVLVVEDEPRLRVMLRAYLEKAGHDVVTTGSGAQALALAASSPPGLVVLDLGLPDLDGETVAAELRALSAVPILMLTARSEIEQRIRGLELGADDYMTKPFSPRELVLRVDALLRRAAHGPPASPVAMASFGGGELVLDRGRRTVLVHGEPVELTPTEWGILDALATHRARVVTRYELIAHARGDEFEGYERTVDSHVKNLRRKLEPDPAQPRIILTVLGAGYRLGLNADA